VGFAFAGVRGEGEHGDAGGGGVKDEGDRAGLGIVAGQGGDAGSVGLGPGRLGYPGCCAGPECERRRPACRRGRDGQGEKVRVSLAPDTLVKLPTGIDEALLTLSDVFAPATAPR
jgi:hypothetical protein